MRHNLGYRKLNKTGEHRKALFKNMLNSLIKYEQIITTLPKAKELKPKIDKVIVFIGEGERNGIDKQEAILEKELQNEKSLNNNFNKESISNQKENENEISSTFNNNKKEKNIITVELTDNEKIVFSQLGINPLLKLGKEYLTSNNIVRLENETKKESILTNEKKSKIKESKIDNDDFLKSNLGAEIKKNSNKEIKDKDTPAKLTDDNQEVPTTSTETV